MSVGLHGGRDTINVPVTSKFTKQLADDRVENMEKLSSSEQDMLGGQEKIPQRGRKLTKQKTYTVDDDVKHGLLSWKEQAHIRAVRKENIELYTHTERLRKEHDHFIRQVRQTGVTLVTNQARTYGFGNPDEAHLWANFGQGAPECGPIPGGPERNMNLTLDQETLEYVISPYLEYFLSDIILVNL